MKKVKKNTVEKYFKEWSGNIHLIYENKDVYDSVEMIEFCEYVINEMIKNGKIKTPVD